MTSTPDDATNELVRTAWLVARVQAGDACRFQTLYERVAPALYAWSSLRLQPSMRAQLEPQDLVQEVWCRALRRFETYSPDEGTFRAWIFGIAKRTLLEALRKLGPTAHRQAEMGPSTRVFALEGVPDHATSIGSRLAADDSVLRFIEFAERSSPEDRRILVLCGLEGRTCGEAARLVGGTENAISKRWRRLRALLRESAWSQRLLDD